MGWYWELMDKGEWWLFLDDGTYLDPMGEVKKTRGMIPYMAKVEGERRPRYFDTLTDAKRYVESYYGVKLTKKRTNTKSKWIRLV